MTYKPDDVLNQMKTVIQKLDSILKSFDQNSVGKYYSAVHEFQCLDLCSKSNSFEFWDRKDIDKLSSKLSKIQSLVDHVNRLLSDEEKCDADQMVITGNTAAITTEISTIRDRINRKTEEDSLISE